MKTDVARASGGKQAYEPYPTRFFQETHRTYFFPRTHLLKVVTFGAIAGTILYVVLDRVREPYDYLFALLAYPFMVALARNVQISFIRPYLYLTPFAMHLRYWQPVPFPKKQVFLPMHRIIERTIPWSEYADCRTFTRSFIGIPIWKALLIETRSGVLTIESRVFHDSVSALQDHIHRYIKNLPKTHAMCEVMNLYRTRFKTPFRFETVNKITSMVIRAIIQKCGNRN